MKVITQASLDKMFEEHAGYTHIRDVDWDEYMTEFEPEQEEALAHDSGYAEGYNAGLAVANTPDN